MRHFLAPSRCLRMCEVFQQCQSVGAAACCASAGVRDIIPRPLQVCRHQQCQMWMTGCGSCCAVFFFLLLLLSRKSNDVLDSAAPLNARLQSQEKRKAVVVPSGLPPCCSPPFHPGQCRMVDRGSADFASSQRCNSSQLCTVAVSVCLCCEHAQLREKR